MTKKNILLITDSHKTENSVREALGKGYHLELAKGSKAAADLLAKKPADLLIIDFDLKGEDGLRVFRSLGAVAKTIMLSASGSIPLAVSAAKLGIEEFLRKPLDAEQLRGAVEKHIAKEALSLRWAKGLEWLSGGSPSLQAMLASVRAVLAEKRDVILVGEPGVPKEQVAEFIHRNGPRKGRRFVKIDAASFRRESFENHFWVMVQELMSLPEAGSIQSGEDRCGTLYLDNVENLDDHFLLSILSFFQERRGKIDKSIQAIIGVSRRSALPGLKGDRYELLGVPPLRERREDLSALLELYLKHSSIKYGKDVRFVSTAALDFLASYDFPGNYLELQRLVDEAVLVAVGDKLELSNLPLDFKGVKQVLLKKGLRENLGLEEARRYLEKKLFYVLLEKAGGDSSRVARFLDIPKAVLTERLENLLD